MPFTELDSPDCIPIPKPEFWVFGYGSLMWDPGFNFIESRECQIYGYHRALCLWSLRYRGTEKCPGLVMGLASGGSCKGIAFKVGKSNIKSTVEYLYGREMISKAYRPKLINLYFTGSQAKQALTFVSRRDHPQYAPALEPDDIVKIVRKARGPRGSNTDYVLNTVEHLNSMGIQDTILQKVASKL